MSNKENTYFDDEEFEYEDDGMKIDWAGIFQKLYRKRKLFLISFVVTILVVYPLARTNPKYYNVVVKLAPELEATGSSSGGLSSIMKAVGVGGGQAAGGDAILPTLYPDLMNSKAFLVSLFDVPVQSKDGKINTTYFDYLAKHQKKSITSKAIGSIFKAIGSLFPEEKKETRPAQAVNAGKLTKIRTLLPVQFQKRYFAVLIKKLVLLQYE